MSDKNEQLNKDAAGLVRSAVSIIDASALPAATPGEQAKVLRCIAEIRALAELLENGEIEVRFTEKTGGDDEA